MKKYLIICFYLLLTTYSLAQEVAIIPDTNFRNAALYQCDINKDGIIQLVETDNLTYLNLRGLYGLVKSLIWIHQFKKLQSIKITECEINEIDFSNNINLQIIEIYSTALKKIYLGKLDNLSILRLQTNELMNVDVSECPNLIDLNIGWNKFTSLDLSKNVNLQTLSCMNNQL